MEYFRESLETVMSDDFFKDNVDVIRPTTREQSDPKLLEKYVLDSLQTIYHPTGTCRMGPGENTVVDPSLKVKGKSNKTYCIIIGVFRC